MAEGERFAFLPSLPLAAVLGVTEALPVPDALRCLAVCKSWNRTLVQPSMSRFWRRVCLHVGLPRYLLNDAMQRFRPPQELYQGAREHRVHVSSIAPALKRFTGSHPFESTLKCEYAGEGFFVKTIDYPTLDHAETIVGRLCTETGEIVRVDTIPESEGEVDWASMAGRSVVWSTGKATDRAALYYYNVETRESGRLFRGQLLSAPDSMLRHCPQCFLFLDVRANSSLHGCSWRLHFYRFNEVGGAPVQLVSTVSIPPSITQFTPRPVSAHFLPCDEGCTKHRLLVQGGTGACMFILEESDGEINFDPQPIAAFNPFFDSDTTAMVVNMTSEMIVSCDRTLVGMLTCVVYPFVSGLSLHIFDLDSYRRKSSVRVEWTEAFNDARVLAVSGLYSIIGVGHSRGVVKVVESRSGRILVQQTGLGRGLPPVVPITRLLTVHYLGVFNEEALLNIFSPMRLILLYRKGVRNIEGVFFHPFPKAIVVEEASDREEIGGSAEADCSVSVP